MTLLDAPKFDETRNRRRMLILRLSASGLLLLFVIWWLVAGRPVAWPWSWNHFLFGRAKVNNFLSAVEANDLAKAYGIWMNDKNWQQHPQEHGVYPFDRFQKDWSANSPDNEYGAIRSHQVVEAAPYGNGVLVASLINGRKSDALNLEYDPKTGQLSFSPPGVSLYLGP